MNINEYWFKAYEESLIFKLISGYIIFIIKIQ